MDDEAYDSFPRSPAKTQNRAEVRRVYMYVLLRIPTGHEEASRQSLCTRSAL
jgi:hypothetical protein